MHTLLTDLKYGVRMLVKAPLVTAIAAGSLALGIAANTSMFSLAYGFLFKPFPFEDPGELVMLEELRRGAVYPSGISVGNLFDYRDGSNLLDEVAAWNTGYANLTGGEEPVQVLSAAILPKSLDVLGLQPVLGRNFNDADADAGAAILTHEVWSAQFGSDPTILDRVIELDGRALTVVGVLGPRFDFIPDNVQVLRAESFNELRDSRDSRSLLALARMRPGATVDQVRADLAPVAAELAERYPEANEGWSASVRTLRQVFPGESDTRLMYVLMAVAMFVLVVAGANVANLLLSRAETRQKEVALRTALGAPRGTIVRQLLTESVLLAILAGGLGVVLSIGGVRFLATAMPAEIPDSLAPALNMPVMLFTVAVSVVAGLLLGLAPATQTLAGSVRDVLNDGARGGTSSKSRKQLRTAFVVGQVAVALALLVGAGGLGKMARNMIAADPGFNDTGLLTFRLSMGGDAYTDDASVVAFHRDVVRSLEAMPGAQSVALMNTLPRGRGVPSTPFGRAGAEQPTDVALPTTNWQSVNRGYFDALEIPLRSGRTFGVGDDEDGAPVAVVNASMVRRYFADQSPIGQRLVLWDREWEIVGVVGDVFHTRVQFDGDLPAMVYVPVEQRPIRSAAYAVRAPGDPLALVPDAREAVWAVDPEIPLSQAQTLQSFVRTEMAGPRALGIVMGVFGLLALFLSAIGIYGVMAHTVAKRTRELGIRLALGARKGAVVGLVTRQGVIMAAAGLVLGAPLAYAVLQFAGGMFVDFSGDLGGLGMHATVAGVLALVTVLASYLPSRRAASIPPMVALREE